MRLVTSYEERELGEEGKFGMEWWEDCLDSPT